MGRGPSLFPEDLGAGFRGWFRLLRSTSLASLILCCVVAVMTLSCM